MPDDESEIRLPWNELGERWSCVFAAEQAASARTLHSDLGTSWFGPGWHLVEFVCREAGDGALRLRSLKLETPLLRVQDTRVLGTGVSARVHRSWRCGAPRVNNVSGLHI